MTTTVFLECWNTSWKRKFRQLWPTISRNITTCSYTLTYCDSCSPTLSSLDTTGGVLSLPLTLKSSLIVYHGIIGMGLTWDTNHCKGTAWDWHGINISIWDWYKKRWYISIYQHSIAELMMHFDRSIGHCRTADAFK